MHTPIGAWVISTLVYCIISLFVMLGYSKAADIKPLPGIFKQVILITMHNPQYLVTTGWIYDISLFQEKSERI